MKKTKLLLLLWPIVPLCLCCVLLLLTRARPRVLTEQTAVVVVAAEEESPAAAEESKLEKMIQQYVKEVHSGEGRWVIARLHNMAGLCNRITQLVSCLALAIATDRVLLFDWEAAPPEMLMGVERIGQTAYKDLFHSPPLSLSVARARADAERASIFHDGAFPREIRTKDLNSLYPQPILEIERFDWWGAPLVLNPLYHEQVFGGASPAEVFSTLFRFLFSPRVQQQAPPDILPCDWLVQRRSRWDRQTAPLEAFVQCVAQHGGGNMSLVADMPESEQQPFVQVNQVGCRDSHQCDVEAVHTLHAYSKCKRAVLTAQSTFGTCIAGLGLMQETYTVDAAGRCARREYVDPMEAGVLPGQERTVENALHAPSGAFVYLIMSHASGLSNFHKSQALLKQYGPKGYPTVLLVDNKTYWSQVAAGPGTLVVEVNQTEWRAAPPDAPDMWRVPSWGHHPGFSLDYRSMSRYAAGFLLGHPSLAAFDYVIKIDTDTFPTARWERDPLEEMMSKKRRVGFWISYSDIDDVVLGLWDHFVLYVRERKLRLSQPGLLMDPVTGAYRNTNLYGCFIGARTADFRSPEYLDLFRHFDKAQGFFYHRWDEQKILAFYTALFLHPDEVEFFDYIHIEHQTLVSPSRLDIAVVPEETLTRVFG
jgi:hypothetical protein